MARSVLPDFKRYLADYLRQAQQLGAYADLLSSCGVGVDFKPDPAAFELEVDHSAGLGKPRDLADRQHARASQLPEKSPGSATSVSATEKHIHRRIGGKPVKMPHDDLLTRDHLAGKSVERRLIPRKTYDSDRDRVSGSARQIDKFQEVVEIGRFHLVLAGRRLCRALTSPADRMPGR